MVSKWVAGAKKSRDSEGSTCLLSIPNAGSLATTACRDATIITHLNNAMFVITDGDGYALFASSEKKIIIEKALL